MGRDSQLAARTAAIVPTLPGAVCAVRMARTRFALQRETQRQGEHAYSALIADPQVAFVSRRMGQMAPADKALIAEFVRRLSASATLGSTQPDLPLHQPLTPETRQDLSQDMPQDVSPPVESQVVEQSASAPSPRRKRRRAT